jgi:sugar lactone lactonase YvrE
VFDRHGGFWLTDYRAGEILYGQADGSRLERVVVGEGARYCNGIGLGPHEQWLCWAETKTRQVRRLSVTAPGRVEPSNGVTVSTLKDGPSHWDSLVVGLPGAQEVDSLAVQADGAICVGTLVDAPGRVRGPCPHQPLLRRRGPHDRLHRAVRHRPGRLVPMAVHGAGAGPLGTRAPPRRVVRQRGYSS